MVLNRIDVLIAATLLQQLKAEALNRLQKVRKRTTAENFAGNA